MILVADSGSTKTDWSIIDNAKIITFHSKGLNPYFINSTGIFQTIQHDFPAEISITEISHVFFYGAGCKSQESKQIVIKGLQDFFSASLIFVESDLDGAAKALLGEKSGNISILGTGMSVGFWDGTQLVQTLPSLGYILGDEGSGAHIGKCFIKAIFEKNLSPAILHGFNESFNLKLPQVLEHVYKNPFPNQFLASFVPFIYRHQSDESIQILLHVIFSEFVSKHAKKIAEETSCFEISFIGSVAYYFRDILQSELMKQSISVNAIESSPIKNLCSYYQNKNLFV